MSKVFRLYKNGDNTFTDWHESASFPYSSENRDGKNGIDDPDGASSKNEITSIPSPFARIDLVKTAFVRVCQPDVNTKKINLDGNTIFHKMVSDTLDVGEIFFNIDKYSDKIEIVKWDSVAMISLLENSDKEGHRYLADALRKYMVSDAKAYNFNQLQDIYILNYKNGLNELDIIGATSPRTIFFSTANRLEDVSKEINFGQDRPFDSDFQPLYKRDKDYVKAWFVLAKSIPDFADLFPEVYEYLQMTLNKLDVNFRNELKGLTSSDPLATSNIQVSVNQQTNIVEVLGYPILKKLNEPIKGSDFEIVSKVKLEQMPLVLPVESGNMYANLHYTTALWGKDNRAGYFDKQDDLNLRRLPNDGTIYPYLTIGDFLEIIKPLFGREREKKELAKVFQALRIEVNQEMEALKEMLYAATEALKPGGRLVVITYHSLEDRMVKNIMKTGNVEGKMEQDFFGNVQTPFKLINNKVIVAGNEEVKQNPRSRSAKLRIAEKK